MISGTFYTLTETAKELGKDRRTINRWMKLGKIEGTRLGNVVLIREEELKRIQKELAA